MRDSIDVHTWLNTHTYWDSSQRVAHRTFIHVRMYMYECPLWDVCLNRRRQTSQRDVSQDTFIHIHAWLNLAVISHPRISTHARTTRSRTWHDAFICVTGLVHICDMTRLPVWHDLFSSVHCLVHTCDMTRFPRVTWCLQVYCVPPFCFFICLFSTWRHLRCIYIFTNISAVFIYVHIFIYLRIYIQCIYMYI